ncbi:conserved hypothetical protein [Verticillium alfalfae VaMs.102]|uniref:Metallo-beta-lactamase domain-containing protein n=1 Tax=Verticillium alfalfae (strain VaMs.102 / ATCC MYA-4576 / FGSC 10136) TaxID=526221 RepID=C9SLQ0_VERA1|nr:conserved hypothetical protein [Verticillium alfalfae VaMs.102]EEY19618.1 conserved hypothetical protein [Verticillium alfalfae VaMs.102]
MYWTLSLALATLGQAYGCCTPERGIDASTSSPLTAQTLLSRGIEALGGSENMANITTLTYVGGDIYRTRSMLESYDLVGVDIPFSTIGNQNVSFSFDGPSIKQRIERNHQLGPYWGFARAALQPMDFTLVVHGGNQGFASVVEGSASLFAPGAPASGFTDGLLASYLIREAHRLSAARVYDAVLGLSVIFDPATNLPYMIRSYENHGVIGKSTQDLVLQHYTAVNNVMFPTRFKSIYNDHNVIADFTVREVLIDSVASTAFEVTGDLRPDNVPTNSSLYSSTEVGEFFESAVWSGEYRGTFANIKATNPSPDLPGLWLLVVEDANLYRQIVYELDDYVVVADCPPHQSLLVIRWVKEKLRKPIKYVWPSHHHHDHIWGITDYVKAGAKVLTVDIARDYYSAIPRDKFVTYRSVVDLLQLRFSGSEF